ARARWSAAQLSLPPLHETAARGRAMVMSERDPEPRPNDALQRLVTERFHVVLVPEIVDRDEAGHTCPELQRQAGVPDRVRGDLQDARSEQTEVVVDISSGEDPADVDAEPVPVEPRPEMA